MTPKSLLAPARLAGRPVLRSQSDERLVDLARSGSEPAFEAIVVRYRAPLVRYCRRILPEARAEDAVQQAFVNALAALRREDDRRIDLRPWLYRIAHNSAVNVLRDRSLRHAELDEAIDGVERPDQALERRQGLRDLITAVKALPERQRDAMILRELDGRSYEEIAVELGVTGGAVRQLLNRARSTLRAGVTAVTPVQLMARLWSAEGEPTAARVGELAGAGGAGALATKVAATALVTGAVAGGIAAGPARHDEGRASADPPAPAAVSEASDRVAARGSDATATGHESGRSAGDDDRGDGGGERDGDDAGDDHSGGKGHSGSGSTERHGGEGGHSGPGGGAGSGDSDDHSGSGGSGSSGPAPGGHSGEGHDGSGGSGSGSSGSGPGGGSDDGMGGSSGSGSSGSGSSGSGSSGSGSSGTGSSGGGSDDGMASSGSSGSGRGSGETTTTTDSSGPG